MNPAVGQSPGPGSRARTSLEFVGATQQSEGMAAPGRNRLPLQRPDVSVGRGADMVGEKAPMPGRSLLVGHQRPLRQTGQHAISSRTPAVTGRPPSPLHELPTSAPPGGPHRQLTTALRRGAPLNERPVGVRRGTRPRQVSRGRPCARRSPGQHLACVMLRRCAGSCCAEPDDPALAPSPLAHTRPWGWCVPSR
jgi:hypothetical protein